MKDRLVRFLNQFGFQPVRLVKTDIRPAQIYNFTPDRVLTRRGPLADFVSKDDQALLKHGDKVKRPDLEHTESSTKNASGAIDFLKGALKAIGVPGEFNVNLSRTKSTAFKFAFSDVVSYRIEPSIIDKIVARMDFARVDPDYVQWGRFHIAYEYLYSRTLLMRNEDNSEFESTFVAKVPEIVDVSTSANISMENSTTVRFQSSGEPVAFAYKAGQIRPHENGQVYFYPEEIVFVEDAALRRAVSAGATNVGRFVYSSEMDPLLAMMTRDRDIVRKPYIPLEGMTLDERV